jgi:hypothetical protein
MAEDDQEQRAPIPSEPHSLQSIPSPIPEPPSTRSQVWLITWALITSNVFALLITFVFEFLSLRGVVDLDASRVVLVAAWLTGLVIVCAFVWGKGIRARLKTVFGGSVLLAALLWALDVWAPKPAIIADPDHLSFDTSLPRENFSLTVQNKTDFYA